MLIQADARAIPLRDGCVQCVVTSPPYWGLRDYGTARWEGGEAGCDHTAGRFARGGLSAKQASNAGSNGDEAFRRECGKCGARRIDPSLGLEATPEEYVANLVAVFREVRRVLRDDGTVWLNLGDSYASGEIGRYDSVQANNGRHWTGTRKAKSRQQLKLNTGLKPKDLVGIPWSVAFALQADGWYLRSDIVWAKPNPMPESVTDRPTRSHEYIFLLTKQARYYWDADAVRERFTDARMGNPGGGTRNYAPGDRNDATDSRMLLMWNRGAELGGRNLRSVWTIPTQPYSGAHFATFPEKLVEPCIKAGSPPDCCGACGTPYRRIVERQKHPTGNMEAQRARTAEQTGRTDGHVSGPSGQVDVVQTLGWSPACACAAEYRDGDFEVIGTPTGARVGQDPTLWTGRAGYNRPRGPDEGRREMTRYEQRQYAEQLRRAPARAAMEAEAGSTAFAHYLRTDRSGARPVPPDLLARWIAAGWLTPVDPPDPHRASRPPAASVVLDPFCGSGTVMRVAYRLRRRGVGCDLNPTYLDLATDRLRVTPLLPLESAGCLGENL